MLRLQSLLGAIAAVEALAHTRLFCVARILDIRLVRVHGGFEKNSILMPRIPTGTAATSALESTCCSLVASLTSSFVGDGLLQYFQSFIVAKGAKLGIPLTVPWPPQKTQGLRSAIRPSRNRNGKGRPWLRDGSSLIAVVSRMSLPMLPPHLQKVRWLIVRRLVGLIRIRELHTADIGSSPHHCFNYSG